MSLPPQQHGRRHCALCRWGSAVSGTQIQRPRLQNCGISSEEKHGRRWNPTVCHQLLVDRQRSGQAESPIVAFYSSTLSNGRLCLSRPLTNRNCRDNHSIKQQQSCGDRHHLTWGAQGINQRTTPVAHFSSAIVTISHHRMHSTTPLPHTNQIHKVAQPNCSAGPFAPSPNTLS